MGWTFDFWRFEVSALLLAMYKGLGWGERYDITLFIGRL